MCLSHHGWLTCLLSTRLCLSILRCIEERRLYFHIIGFLLHLLMKLIYDVAIYLQARSHGWTHLVIVRCDYVADDVVLLVGVVWAWALFFDLTPTHFLTLRLLGLKKSQGDVLCG